MFQYLIHTCRAASNYLIFLLLLVLVYSRHLHIPLVNPDLVFCTVYRLFFACRLASLDPGAIQGYIESANQYHAGQEACVTQVNPLMPENNITIPGQSCAASTTMSVTRVTLHFRGSSPASMPLHRRVAMSEETSSVRETLQNVHGRGHHRSLIPK